MALTGLEMVGEVLDNMAREGSATTRNGTTLSAMAVRWLNRAQTQAARLYDMLFTSSTVPTVIDQAAYTLPTGLRSLSSIRIEDGSDSHKMICVMPWNFDALVPKPDEDTTQRPLYYIPYATTNTFTVYRIPDAVYTMRLRYSFWPAALSADASTSSYQAVGIDADDATIALATSYGYSYLQELIDAQKWSSVGWNLWKDVYHVHKQGFPDWAPRMIGYGARDIEQLPGEYYNNPFILNSP